jgi:hypothetical protein
MAPRKFFPDTLCWLHSQDLSTVPRAFLQMSNIPGGRHRQHTRQVESMHSNPSYQSDTCLFELHIYTVVSILKTCAYLDCLSFKIECVDTSRRTCKGWLANSKSNDPLVKLEMNAHHIHWHLEQRTCMNSINVICEDGLEKQHTSAEEGKQYPSENRSKLNFIQSHSVAHLPLGKHISPLPIPSPCPMCPFYTQYGGLMRNLHLLVFLPCLRISN